MELTQENIEKLASKLTIRKLEESTEVMQDYFLIAERLIKENPDKTIDEIAEIYEAQMRDVASKNNEHNLDKD